ncbi:hypothetical protein ACFQ9Q_30505 [Streptomyces virginiae]|uniref:hypothetical protein n=1 Tax=Streptomyces virginiae TaxID=1961 RepID=UPI0036A931D9
MGVQRCVTSVLISADGELDEDAGGVLLQALNSVTPTACSISWTCTGARSCCA